MNIDYGILQSRYVTDRIILNQNNKLKYVSNLLKLLLSVFTLPKYKLIITWFGDYHSAFLALICKLIKRKLILFIGGYDAVYYPQEKIGVYCNPFRSFFTRYSVTHSTLIVANHESLIEYVNTYIDGTNKKSGLKNIIKRFNTPYRIIYNGIETDRLADTEIRKEEKLVLTVGSTPTWVDVYNKGYDLLIASARLLPDYRFVFVNIRDKWLDRMEQQFHYRELTNIRILSYVPQNELHDLYSRAQIYAQPSLSEGMPNALAEAMLFECIPVGSNVAGIPTVIDNYGIVIHRRRTEDLVAGLQKAASLNTGKAAAQFIKDNFSLKKRSEKILQAVESVLSE
jgi:glycosyltransferase involved in cell wall biosynthesis